MVAVLVACLIALPTDCRTVEFILVERMPVPAWIEAEQRADRWLQQHPGRVLRMLRVVRGRAA